MSGDPHIGGERQSDARAEFREGDLLPDITVKVAADRDDMSEFDVWVTSPHFPDLMYEPPQRWPLPKRAGDLVVEYMRDITDAALEPGQLRARLVGIGKKLFDVAPPVFRDVYWELADSRPARAKTILVQSEEWAIPWELMVPYRPRAGTFPETQLPLGFQVAIGRWLPNNWVAPPQSIGLRDSYVFAPRYKRGQRLPHAREETKFVLEGFAGERIRPGRMAALDAALGRRSVTLLHFTCHGEAASPPVQAILLEGNGRLLSYELAGWDSLRVAVQQTRPMVFLNACEVGRPAPSLVGVGGFAMEFISLGASCVVAPLWSVKDDIAFEVAQEFYSRVIADPTVLFADVMRKIRRRSLDTDEDSYAAYTLYGDPFSSRSISTLVI